MGRSKEMGKPVAELTAVELRRERGRCAAWLRVRGTGPAAKLVRKRLHEIEKRMGREAIDS